MIAGGVTLAVGYLAGIGYAASQGFDNGTGWLAVPVAGPWGAIQARDFKCKSSAQVSQKDINRCVDGALGEVGAITFLAMSGLVQAVGATLFLVGAGTVDHQWVRADLAEVEVQAAPGPVGTGYGLQISGKF
jgi:hypothetical protein